MNKIFKVVWSKTKECYVVVSEVAKNNGGKKKVLASVLAGLAMVGAGAMGTPVHADVNLGNSAVNISPNGTYNGTNSVGVNSVVVGYQNKTDNNAGTLAYGANNTAVSYTHLDVYKRQGSELQLTPRVSFDMGYNKPEHNSGGAYGKITFRLAGSPVAWYGGKHSVEGAMSVRSKMLSLVRRHNTIWVE